MTRSPRPQSLHCVLMLPPETLREANARRQRESRTRRAQGMPIQTRRPNRKRIDIKKGAALVDEARQQSDPLAFLAQQFPDGAPVMPRSFPVQLDTLARFLKICDAKTAAGDINQTDLINDALAQWCEAQEKSK